MATKPDESDFWKESISVEERCHHELLFYSQGPVEGHLSDERARDLFLHSGLPLTVLSKIWNLADVSNDNVLSVEEFSTAMHLILGMKEGHPLPKRLPKHLVPTVTAPTQIPEMTDRERLAYQNVFNKLTQEQIDAIQGRLLLLESQLTPEELSRVWDLADTDKDGKLDQHQWSIACHLMRAMKQGVKFNGPVNVYQLVPERLSPTCYQARKHRVDVYNKKKHQLMSAKEKRKTQIDNEKKRLELLKKRLALHKELYEYSKSSGDVSIPEEEYLLYKEKEENNIEKVEAIVYRLKKEHENIRQITVKAILGEHESLQEDGRLLKIEQESVRSKLSTHHTHATKEPDPFHQLYELRKELRKRSTLSEGEEPEVHFPFHPFKKHFLHPQYCGPSIFLTPDPAVFNNNNSHRDSGLLEELHKFGEKFIDQWAGDTSSTDPDYDPVFMSLNVPMEPRNWSGLQWAKPSGGDARDKIQTLHQKLTDLKIEMEKLTEDTSGQLLFRNPEDYLARRKAQEEEDRLEKSKYQRRFHGERRADAAEIASKRRSFAGTRNDEELSLASKEYRNKRRSLNLDKLKSEKADKKTDKTDIVKDKPARPARAPKASEPSNKNNENKKELKVSTKQEAFVPESASSPRQSEGSNPTSPRLATSPPRPSTKRKAAPPPPCSGQTSPITSSLSAPFIAEGAVNAEPVKTVPVKAEPVKVEAPVTKPLDETDGQTQSLPVAKVTKDVKTVDEDKSKPEAENTTQLKDKLNNQVNESVPKAPPRRKKSKSEDRRSFLHESFEKEQSQRSKEIAVNVDIKETKPVDKLNDKVLTNDHSSSNSHGYVNVSLNSEKQDSLLDSIVKEIPSLQQNKPTSKPVIDSNGMTKDSPDVEEVIVARVDNSVECEIKPQAVTNQRGKFVAANLPSKIELLDKKVEEPIAVDSDSDTEVVAELKPQRKPSEDIPESTVDFVEPIRNKNKSSGTIDQAFEKIFLIPNQKEKSKDTISIASDISSTGSEAPPLPDSAPPPLPCTDIPELVKKPEAEIDEVMEVSVVTEAEAAPKMQEDSGLSSPRSPVNELKAEMFSMRMKSPTREGGANGALSVDVNHGRRGSNSDSDISDDEGKTEGVTGTFTPGEKRTNDVPITSYHHDDGGIQLLSYNNKLHSPNSDQSGPDSAFEDMQSSMTSNDPLSSTLDDITQDDYITSERTSKVSSAPNQGEVVTTNARKFELALERSSKSKSNDVKSPVGSKDFMAKAHMFAESVQKPPKMTVKLKREITNPEDLSDEHYLQLEKERQAVISSSTVKKRNIDLQAFVDDEADQDSQGERLDEVDPDATIQEWRTEVNKRSNIAWDEKPGKVNLYSENVIQETDNTESVDRDSIANLNTTRQQWETKLKPVEATSQKPKHNPGKVRHWEVKLPTQLRTVPVDAIRSTKDDSDSDSENMASTEYANESAIEREIRLANEREELLRKEQEERQKLSERQNASPAKLPPKEAYIEQNNNNNNSTDDDRPTYHEMTEADRGSELQQREELIQLEIEEQAAREAAFRGDQYQVQDETSSEEDENANESIIEREIRLQREREMEIARLRNGTVDQSPVEEEIVEIVEQKSVEVQETVPASPTPVSIPDALSETEDDAGAKPQPRTRISYEEAISSASHQGESLIARELREAREREEELQRQREMLNTSVKSPQKPQQQPQSSTPTVPKETKQSTPKVAKEVKQSTPSIPKESNQTPRSESGQSNYQNDVSPFKNTRRQSQDSASSHSTERSQPAMKTMFGGQLSYRTPERKEKSNVKKPETPIEREMRLNRERENEFRISKGLAPLPDLKKPDEAEEKEKVEEKEELTFSKSPFSGHTANPNRDGTMKRLASSRLQKEINQQNKLEKTYRDEGKIMSTSEDHVGALRYTELTPADTMPPKRNFSIARKSTTSLHVEPETKQNGTPEPVSVQKVQEQPAGPKFGRSVSSGGVTFSYKESRHKAESTIERELREMREREEELRSQRSNAGLLSPTSPDSPRNQDNQSVVSKRSQFEQTS